jgi:hypothetical protein
MIKTSKKILNTFISPMIVGLVIGMFLLILENKWFLREKIENEQSDSLSQQKHKPSTNPSEYKTSFKLSEKPKIIQELSTISDAKLLLSKLDEYNKRGILAIGGRDDFDNPDGFFVFVLGETRVYGTFLFHNNDFWDLRTNIRLTNLPEQLRDKQQIWVIEADKLVQH